MNRTEARETLVYAIGEFVDNCIDAGDADKYWEAMTYYDSLPEVAPSNGDLISRADAIHTVRNSEVLLSYDSEWSCDVLAESAIDQTRDCLTHALKALPSAEADCSTCKHKDKDWDSEECDSCCGNNSHYASAEAVEVAYICDGRKCDSDCSECFRTTDIEHARDFKKMCGKYYQQPSAEADMSEYADRLWKIAYERGKNEAVQGWIPCSERLPEWHWDTIDGDNVWIGERVLACVKEADEWYESVGIATYGPYGWVEGDEVFYSCTEPIPVIAWMPLPEPYEGSESE